MCAIKIVVWEAGGAGADRAEHRLSGQLEGGGVASWVVGCAAVCSSPACALFVVWPIRRRVGELGARLGAASGRQPVDWLAVCWSIGLVALTVWPGSMEAWRLQKLLAVHACLMSPGRERRSQTSIDYCGIGESAGLHGKNAHSGFGNACECRFVSLRL